MNVWVRFAVGGIAAAALLIPPAASAHKPPPCNAKSGRCRALKAPPVSDPSDVQPPELYAMLAWVRRQIDTVSSAPPAEVKPPDLYAMLAWVRRQLGAASGQTTELPARSLKRH